MPWSGVQIPHPLPFLHTLTFAFFIFLSLRCILYAYKILHNTHKIAYIGEFLMVKTTLVGSLPRPQQVVDFIFARENNTPYDQQDFDTCMRRAVSDCVAKQKQAGIHIVSDGEMSKISYATYVKDRYHGFSGDSPRNAPADLLQFPSFLDRIAKSGGTPQYARPMCTGKLCLKSDNEDLQKDIQNFKSACAEHGIEQGFMSTASPGVVSLFMQNAYYQDREEYLWALADVMQQEYENIVQAGFKVQLDCPDLALSRHMLFAHMSDAEFIKIITTHMEALNHALRNIDEQNIRLHVCWGNYEGPHCCDIGMDKIFDTLMSCRTGALLFETANPRHAHESMVFAENKHRIPDTKVLIPGVIDTTTNFIEHPEVIRQRIQKFVDIVGYERVIAGTDCGFGTFAGFGAVDPDIAYAKLQSLAEGAKRV